MQSGTQANEFKMSVEYKLAQNFDGDFPIISGQYDQSNRYMYKWTKVAIRIQVWAETKKKEESNNKK